MWRSLHRVWHRGCRRFGSLRRQDQDIHRSHKDQHVHRRSSVHRLLPGEDAQIILKLDFVVCGDFSEWVMETISLIHCSWKNSLTVSVCYAAAYVQHESQITQTISEDKVGAQCFSLIGCPPLRCVWCSSRKLPWPPSALCSASSGPPFTRWPWSCVWSVRIPSERPRPPGSSSCRGTAVWTTHTTQ